MEHPNSKCRIAQAEYLSRLPEEERENKARDIRIGNASYIYHQQAVPIQENRLIMYYKEWLEGLPPNISRILRVISFTYLMSSPNCHGVGAVLLLQSRRTGVDNRTLSAKT